MSILEETKASLIETLNEANFNYEEKDGIIIFGMSGDNVQGVFFAIDFDESGDSVHIQGINIASFKDKLAEGFVTVNRLNSKYRWSKFVITSEGDLTVTVDAVIEPVTAGKEILELVGRNFHIVDEAYPEIMREIWG